MQAHFARVVWYFVAERRAVLRRGAARRRIGGMSDPFDTGVVTIMFTDVEGSMDLSRRPGDEVARRTIDAT
jgi:class 3 adenylate cyclase